jgi:prevent-host-death family protein
MAQVPKSTLDVRVWEYLQRVKHAGEEIVVTENGHPVVRVVPVRARRPASELFADVRGRVVYHDDVMTPTTAEWPEM